MNYSLSPEVNILKKQLSFLARSIRKSQIIEQWRQEYNQVRPHSALRYQPPAPEAKISVTLT